MDGKLAFGGEGEGGCFVEIFGRGLGMRVGL